MRQSGWRLASALVSPCVPPISASAAIGLGRRAITALCVGRLLVVLCVIMPSMTLSVAPCSKLTSPVPKNRLASFDQMANNQTAQHSYLGLEVPDVGRNGGPYLCGLLHRSWLSRARVRAGSQP